jgi:hypothetical protein
MQRDHGTPLVGRWPQPAGRGRTYTACFSVVTLGFDGGRCERYTIGSAFVEPITGQAYSIRGTLPHPSLFTQNGSF